MHLTEQFAHSKKRRHLIAMISKESSAVHSSCQYQLLSQTLDIIEMYLISKGSLKVKKIKAKE
jgi:NAD-dependent oxidoreductase involved in siderophore biosynthesis